MSEKYYWLNDKSRKFLSSDYLYEGVTPEQRVRDISIAAEKYLKIKGFASKLEEYIALGWISLSTPIWANFGLDRGLPISCFSTYIPDTMNGILEKNAEVGMMTKMGGGTSAYFGDLRARGVKISTGGESSGPIHFMELFEATTNIISQSSIRRGSFAAYLPVEHPDILEFLKIRSEGHKIQHLSIGVCITDKWMESMLAGDKNKRKVWGDIVKKRFESGYPYIFFTDTVNRKAPQVYKDKDLKINNSNLCVSGDQRIPSNFGLLTAKELHDINKQLILVDNNKTVKASAMKLIEKNADTYKITLENGMSHTVTEYHKISVAIKDKYILKGTIDIECKNLKVGDSVAIQTNKGIFGQKHMPQEAFLLGLYQGDGTQHDDLIMLDIWENDFDLLDEIKSSHDFICEKYGTQKASNNRLYNKPNFSNCAPSQGNVRKKRLASNALKKCLNFEKGYVPQWIWESDEETQWQYIRGLYYTDGTVGVYSGKGDAIQLNLASINKVWLQEIQLLLANLGLQTSIRIMRYAGQSNLPDGKGSYKLYNTKDCWRIIIGNKNDCLTVEKHTGFLSRKGVLLENRVYGDNTKKFYKIKSIDFVGKQDVFCCKVDSIEQHFICNGIITHNCAEITLSTNEKESFVCDLAAVNLLHYDDWKDTDLVETVIYLLDAVMTEFINKAENTPFMSAPVNFAKNQRALGLGVLGWHSYLQSKMIEFESFKAKMLNVEIFKLLDQKSLKATKELAKLYGEPPLLKGYGVRNVTRLALMPTTSSSFILGQVSPSIEPLSSNYFVKDLAKGKFTYKNPYLKDLLAKYDKDDNDTWKSILIKGGSVQHLDFLTTEEKGVFKTFGEISQKEIVIQASQRQQYICQSQSLNLMVGPKIPAKEVSELLIEGWHLGIKTFYYQRSANPSQELSRSLSECKSCQV